MPNVTATINANGKKAAKPTPTNGTDAFDPISPVADRPRAAGSECPGDRKHQRIEYQTVEVRKDSAAPMQGYHHPPPSMTRRVEVMKARLPKQS